jgi:hypothetical protein
MTFNSDIQKTEKEIAVLQAKLDLLKEIEIYKSQPKMTLENEGDFSIVSCDGYVYYRMQYPSDVIWYRKSMVGRLEPIKDIKTKNELESQWLMNDVKYQNDDEVEWDEKDNPASIGFKIADEVVNRLVKKRQAQKLFNRLVDELGYDFDACDDIVDIVEDWILEEQSASGSQNVNTELLVEGFNDAIRKMKEMLR